MNNKLLDVIQRINAKKITLIFSVVIIFHVIFILHIVQDNRAGRQALKHNALIQKIVNVIYLMQATPVKNREAAIAAMDDPDLTVTLTKNPASSLRYNRNSSWKIMHALENNARTYFISIQLNKMQWLNIKAMLYGRLVLTHLFFLIIEIIIFGVILLSLWSVNRFVTPLQTIKSSAERLGIHFETKPFAVYGPKIIREVSLALNQMQKRIMQLVQNRTQLLAAISHDLRTPIARAQLRLQFMQNGEHKKQLLNDLDEMERMISETLSFAREEATREEKKNIDLVSLLESICDDENDMGHNVVFHTNEHRIAFFGRPIALKRAFTNLINNAIRYAGDAAIRIKHVGKNIIIEIEDNGPGVAESELEKVFEPFYRGEQSRSRDTGGVGLGLSVARDIVHAHHGKIKLENKKMGGLCVIVELINQTAS